MGEIFPQEVSGDNAEHVEAVGRLVFFEILSVVLQLLSIVFNGAIICTLCRRSLLKYPSNRFVFSLCLSHLVVSFLSVSISLLATLVPSQHSSVYKSSHDLVNQPQLEASSPSAQHSPVPVQCTANSGVDLAHLIMMHINFGVAVCTSVTVALISAERYITIARPMRYKSIVTARRSLCAIICCWLLAALITMMPLLLFENRNPECGTFSLPMESLATYFGIVFTVVTIFALAVMIVCYSHIFRIAKAKCQKVQIGHFTASTVSSISSDWPSSAYSSVQGQHRFLHAGSRIESSNSLLHWVLMTNLGRHNPLRMPNAHRRGVPLTPPATPTLPPKNAFFSESALNNRRESDETTTTGTNSGNSSRNGSTSSSNSGGGGVVGGGPNSSYFIDPSRSPFQYHHLPHRRLRNRWKTYLQPNYNSPRKTIFTIMLLIGAVLFTQLPLSFVLFTSTVETTQRWFQFCITVLFSTSSVANPVLYGFLNRSIRDQLWRLLKRKGHGGEHGPSASSIRKRKRGQQQLEEITQASKNILSTTSQHHLQTLCRDRRVEVPSIKISRKESISSDDNSVDSTNSINISGKTASSAKAKINQVQNRIASSPYYRTVLLKKANKNKPLLPRLVLPDVNVRRNSSGSIISIRTNGVMSKKAKVKENNEWDEPTNKYDGNGATTQQSQISVEMQTFHNYSTPDLPSSSSSLRSAAVTSHTHNDSELRECDEDEISHSSSSSDNIEIRSQNNSQGQVQLPQENDTDNLSLGTCSEQQQENSCHYKTTDHETTVSSDHDNDKPGPSRTITGSDQEHPAAEKLEMCLSVETLMGVVIDEEVLPENFPRKPSQDSGADMTFSDEEDELPPPVNPTAHNDQQVSSPILISTAALSSLPVAMRGKACSATSLAGPFLLIGHPDTTGNFRSLSNITHNQPTDILFLPCSCAAKSEDDNKMNETPTNQVDNSVTVTITDSNSDTDLFNPHLFNSNQNLLHNANNSRPHHHTATHILHHHPHCIRGVALKALKSKSESDICRRNESHVESNISFEDADLKIRSNCHINLVLDKHSNSTDSAFNRCDCSHNNHKVKEGISPSSCAVWVNDGQLPVWNGSASSQQYLLRGNTAPVSIPATQSQHWLSVMSVHSSCSSLSSTCPLRILEGYNKSDVSDYEDLEDHIEI